MSELIYTYVRRRSTYDLSEFVARLPCPVIVYKSFRSSENSEKKTHEILSTREFNLISKLLRKEAHQYRVQKLETGLLTNDLSFGRDEANAICIGHESVSKKHLSIKVLTSGEIYVVDHNSRNGTFLNTQQLPAETPRPLSSGDVIRMGGVDLHYFAPPQFFDFLSGLLLKHPQT